MSRLGRAGVKLLWSVLGEEEKQPGRGCMRLGSSKDWEGGALLAESWFSPCPGPKEPASSPAFPSSGLGFSYSKEAGLCDNFGFQQLPFTSGETEAESDPQPFGK